MKAIAVFLLVLGIASLAISIPLEKSSEAPEDSKDDPLASQVRQKRGWGYETAWVPSYGPVLSSSVLGPSRTVISSPVTQTVAVAAPVTSTHYVVPQHQKVVAVPSGHHSESFVYSSGPDHTYYVHQKHHPHNYYYYHYPASTSYLTHYPTTTHYVSGAPVLATWP